MLQKPGIGLMQPRPGSDTRASSSFCGSLSAIKVGALVPTEKRRVFVPLQRANALAKLGCGRYGANAAATLT